MRFCRAPAVVRIADGDLTGDRVNKVKVEDRGRRALGTWVEITGGPRFAWGRRNARYRLLHTQRGSRAGVTPGTW